MGGRRLPKVDLKNPSDGPAIPLSPGLGVWPGRGRTTSRIASDGCDIVNFHGLEMMWEFEAAAVMRFL